MATFSSMREASNALEELYTESAKIHESYAAKRLKEANTMVEDADMIKEHRAFMESHKEDYKQKAFNECLGTAFKGIFITAIQRDHVLSESDIRLAEDLVDKFIEEQGGGQLICRKMRGTTQLKEMLSKLVEDAVEDAEENASDDEKDFEETPDETKEEMLDKMEKEDSIDSAVEMIASRIATAEEEFIAKNKEDKEKIEALVADINQRLDAVQADPTVSDETKEEAQEEAAREINSTIRNYDHNRKHSIYEHMIRKMGGNIMKDEQLRAMYCNESGKIDMGKATVTGTVLYGFLEFVNTLKLVDVDEAYVEKIIAEL